MISVDEAIQIILAVDHKGKIDELPLAAVAGRVTATGWRADADTPPFDRVMMDGYAFRYDDVNEGSTSLRIAGIQKAGEEPLSITESNTCIEIMTGAVCPSGADTVVQYELTEVKDGHCFFDASALKRGQNIHHKGRDKKSGEQVLNTGSLIGPAETGVAASIGLQRVKVRSLPHVHVVSTGDELVEIYTTPKPHQIRRSNVYAISHMMSELKINPYTSHLGDDVSEIKNGLQSALENSDVVIITGGVSKGKFDHVPQVLEELGVEKLFHRIAQRPGKPFWFGKRGEKVVFALPGNPVSAFLCSVKYIMPWLRQSVGLSPEIDRYAVLAQDYKSPPSLTLFLQVKLNWSDSGQLIASPQPGGGSGDYLNLVEADAFLELPPNEDGIAVAGKAYKVYPIKSI